MQTHTVLAVIVVTAALTGDANAIDCHASKGAGHPWAWRQVDGKRCWYKGKAGISKTRLRWPSVRRAPPPAKKLLTAPSADDELLHSVWPPLETFEDRFIGDRK